MEYAIKAAPKFLIMEVPAEEETTQGGIILAAKETPSTAWAKVISVGDDAAEHFLLDDVVLFRRRDAMPFSADGVELLAILHDQILATKRGA